MHLCVYDCAGEHYVILQWNLFFIPTDYLFFLHFFCLFFSFKKKMRLKSTNSEKKNKKIMHDELRKGGNHSQ